MAFHVNFVQCSEETIRVVTSIIAEWQSDSGTIQLQTSGSTGLPKTIHLLADQITASAKRTNDFFNLTQDSTVMCCISPKFIGGRMVILRALVGDYSVVVTEPTKIENFASNYTFDLVSFVPLQLEKLIKYNSSLLLQIKQILLGGTGITEEQNALFSNLRATCYLGFGMTETVSHFALKRIHENFYTCLDHVFVRSENGRLVLDDAALGIQNLHTNDLVECISENSFIWLGRADFTINSGGIKIQPESIEKIIEAFIDGPFFIAGIADSKLGQRCVLCLDQATQLRIPLKGIQQEIAVVFGPYAIPKEILHVKFVRSETGKLLRKITLQKNNYDA